MRARTKSALVDAVRRFCEVWNSADPSADEWRAVFEMQDNALTLHLEDVARGDPNAQRFDGAYYNPGRDDQRLTLQIGRVFEVMSDGQWHSLPELHERTGDPEASIEAQLCHLRKVKHGSWIIDCERLNPRSALYYRRMRNPDGTELPPINPRPDPPGAVNGRLDRRRRRRGETQDGSNNGNS